MFHPYCTTHGCCRMFEWDAVHQGKWENKSSLQTSTQALLNLRLENEVSRSICGLLETPDIMKMTIDFIKSFMFMVLGYPPK